MARFGMMVVMVIAAALLSVRCGFAGDDSVVRQMKVEDMQVSASSTRAGMRALDESSAAQQAAHSLALQGEAPLLFVYEGDENDYDFVTEAAPSKADPPGFDNSTRFKIVPRQHKKQIRVSLRGGTLDEAFTRFAQSAGLDVRLYDKGRAVVLIDPDLARDTTWPLNARLDAADLRPVKYSEVKQLLVSKYGWAASSAAHTQLCDCPDDVAWKGTEGQTVRDLLVAFLKHGQERAHEGAKASHLARFSVQPFHGDKPRPEWVLLTFQ